MRNVLISVTTIAAVLLLAPAAHAAPPLTFCVNDPECVANGGTSQPDIPTAVTAADANAGVDRIFVGASATPYVLSGTVTLTDVRLYGAGIGTTTIQAHGTDQAFNLNGPESRLARMTVVGGTTTSTSLITVTAGGANAVSIDTVRIENRTTSANTTALSIYNVATTVQRATIDGGSGSGYALAASGAALDATVTDSTLTGYTSIDHENGGTLTLLRDRVEFRQSGIRAYYVPSANGTQTLRGSSLLIRGSSAGLAVGAAALRAQSNAFNADATLDIALNNVTAIHPGAGLGSASVALVSTLNTEHNQLVKLRFDGWNVAGAWQERFDVGSPVAGAAYDGQIDHVNSFPAKSDTLAAGVIYPDEPATALDPKFVDQAGGDYHLRWDSPLLDAGSSIDPASWESFLDLDRNDRTVNKTGSGTKVRDIGAYEYVRRPPSISTAPPSGTVTPGSALAYSVTGSDANAGEAAALTYAWTLPDGSTRTGSAVTFSAPTAPGSYALSVLATDPSGLTASASAVIVVPAAGEPPVAAPPLLADLDAPKVKVTPAKTTLQKLLARKALTAKVAPSEAISAKLVLVATIARAGAKPKTVPVASTTLKLAAGTRTASFKPTKAAIAKVQKLRSARGAKLTWTITGTATDAAGNRTSVAAKVGVR